MGNYIQTKNGIEISLSIPAQITSFETSVDGSSHVTKGKLKVFSIGKTGDIRYFSREFAEDLINSLPGTPVVAFYDEEKDDFIGHNDCQYVYGYVPEDAVPEFVNEDNGRTFAIVDVNLFTERDDNIGEVANKIIGKAQSLELDPATVDWELVYINNRLVRINFKKGRFYGLSVLGNDQTPAFEGAGFFTADVINKIKQFQSTSDKDGGNQKMNKTDFLSLTIQDKISALNKIVEEKNAFEYFQVFDFDEERIYLYAYTEETGCQYYAAEYNWDGEDNYSLGDFYEVIRTYVRKEKENSEVMSPIFEEHENDDEEKPEIEDEGNQSDDEENQKENEDFATCTEEKQNIEESGIDEGHEEFKQEEVQKIQKEEIEESAPTDLAALTSEERRELEALRYEKKISLIAQYREYLSEEAIKDFTEKINDYDYNSLEKELKIKSFDNNKNKLNQDNSTFGAVLPGVQSTPYSNTLDRLVAENLKR